MKYVTTLKSKLIYVFRINDVAHYGCLKIGEATANEDEDFFTMAPNSSVLNKAAKKRIDSYTQTAGIAYDLLYTESSIYSRKGTLQSFSDSEVHEVLSRSGIKKKVFNKDIKANEWFITDLATVQKAIRAVKEGKNSLHPGEITQDQNPIIFRPEQKEAIEKTIKQFKKSNKMLWNAKMRFGKTLSALEVVKQMNFKRTLILTHRPVVDKGWFEDFSKIFYDVPEFHYGSKNSGNPFKVLELLAANKEEHYVYFASMQDLRGSSTVGGKFDKNDILFKAPWDFIIVDEAHEGTQTELGKNVLTELLKADTKELQLSGTPFNLLDDYKENEIYTWDYVMEQRAKANWDQTHFGDPNPYAPLPRLHIFTFDLGKIFEQFRDEAVAFNFKEFFRVNEAGDFIHQKDIHSFINLISKKDEESKYPYATEEYRKNFRHSLWMLPGVREARALSLLLKRHPVFSQFTIVNVAGDGDEEEQSGDALKKVEGAITDHPEETYTITLSCGRLTTGVTVPAWTAVFMLAGSYNTSASAYMQTIFRVQSPATINGRVKEECFVFDFAPDRTLKVIAETAKISAKVGKTSTEDRKIMGEFLNFCPIIGVDGSRMLAYDVNRMMEQLKKVYVERVVRNGFEDGYLYNNDMLMKLDQMALEDFKGLKETIGSTKAMPKSDDVDINKQGFTEEEFEQVEKAKKKKREELSEEEKILLEERKEKKKNRDTAISILRGISIRMPLMIYGAKITDEDKELTIHNFEKLVDNQSWEEFMPKGVDKATFRKFKKYYEPDVFRAAGKKIRAMTRAADHLPIEERIGRIAVIFGNFRNPDKETVLTPWRVVNMHLGDCLGGYVFYDERYEKVLEQPRFVDQGEVTKEVYATDACNLEINAKSGLYALFLAYNIYRSRLEQEKAETLEAQQALWDKTVAENIFVICKTPMAKHITNRTLVGFREDQIRPNSRYFEDVVHQIKDRPEKFIEKIKKGESFWKANNNHAMKFNAIVGNPPYQEMDGGSGVSAKPTYHLFVDIAKRTKPNFISMIMPARWYAGGKGLDSFRNTMLKDKHIYSLFDYPNSNECFTNVDIAGGLCYFLWNRQYKGDCTVTNCADRNYVSLKRPLNEFEILIRDNIAIKILRKVLDINKNKPVLSDRVSSRKPFGLATNYAPKKEGIPCWFIQKIGLSFANPSDVTNKDRYLSKWKLLIPPAPIAGQTDFTRPVGFYYDGNTRIAKPGECCTESWIIAGAFGTENETLSFKSYLFSKIVRFLLLQSVVSQHVTKSNFSFVPDLGEYEGIYTDKKLCALWNISEEEWNYIDSRIHNYGN